MKATARPKGGKGAARAARRAGNVPGVIYGDNKPPMMVLIEHDELRKRIYAGRFLTTLYELDVDGAKHRVIPRDFQLDADQGPADACRLPARRRKAPPSACTSRCTCSMPTSRPASSAAARSTS